uniref:Tudor domain-containing protein 1 n=1 Tax=Lepisosteus oculatus TaxID=7918 RepID=W5N2D9_LEPOC|nr:PREDICTED: tudor domain-containing protein 1 isoform X2 [Lepisosteus oculatus]
MEGDGKLFCGKELTTAVWPYPKMAEGCTRFEGSMSQPVVTPNLPLRRPTSSPIIKSSQLEVEIESSLTGGKNFQFSLASEEYLGNKSHGTAPREETNQNGNGSLSTEGISFTKSLGSPGTVKICHVCHQKGFMRCTRCKQTTYCSVSCQREDWKTHRHVCKPYSQKSSKNQQGQPTTTSEAKEMITIGKEQEKKMYLSDLQKMDIKKGLKVQACVVEFRNPGKFFIHIQTAKMIETLKKVTLTLQKIYSNSISEDDYIPDVEEVCAAQYSQDQNWYRCLVQSLDISSRTANVIYIDFGNEEDVKLDKIKRLSVDIDPVPPCALQCRVANLAAVTGSWVEVCCSSVRQLLLGKTCLVTIVDVSETDSVCSVDVALPSIGMQLEEFLVQQGYVVKQKVGKSSPNGQDINSILCAALENFRKKASTGVEDDKKFPEPVHLCIGDSFSCVVTHILSPHDFVIQKLDNAGAIQELQIRLRDHCVQIPSSEDYRPAPGTVCCSQFTEDNLWYRATVLGYSSEDRVFVGYIDFGNSEELELNRLRPANEEFLKLPMQAITCSLPGIKPVSEEWDSESILVMKKLVNTKFLKVRILDKVDVKALVELTDEYSDPQTNIADLMVAMRCAVIDLDFRSQTDQTEGTKESFTKKLEWTSTELPSNETVDVVVSVIDSPSEFYCQCCNPKDLQALNEMSANLLKCSQKASEAFTPVIGEPCCAVFPGDGNWYRGMINDIGPKGAEVYFVDYGNTSEVAVDKLCAILPEYLMLPFQAIKCWLAGVEPVQREWTKDAIKRFQALTVGVQLKAKVLCNGQNGYGIKLVKRGQNVAEKLVAEKLAVCNKTFHDPVLTSIMPGTEPTGGYFPKDWKTVELPKSGTFQLHIVAVRNPSLFYGLKDSNEVDVKKLEALMAELSSYCNKQSYNPNLKPEAGVACCAQFSGDKNWYRAIVLDICDSEAYVLYADYGNIEKVPLSSILPITAKHLELPFQIIKCQLSEELFPDEWSSISLECFESLLRGKVMASVRKFDGKIYTVHLTVCSDNGNVDVSKMMIEKFGKIKCETDAGVIVTDTNVKALLESNTTCTPPIDSQPTNVMKCCCQELKEKIDKLEELLLVVIKEIVHPQKNY